MSQPAEKEELLDLIQEIDERFQTTKATYKDKLEFISRKYFKLKDDYHTLSLQLSQMKQQSFDEIQHSVASRTGKLIEDKLEMKRAESEKEAHCVEFPELGVDFPESQMAQKQLVSIQTQTDDIHLKISSHTQTCVTAMQSDPSDATSELQGSLATSDSSNLDWNTAVDTDADTD